MPRRQQHRPSPRRLVAVVAAAVGLLTAISLTAGPTADAQAQEEGTVRVEAGHPLGSSIHYVVEVTRADDAPAKDATVTATVLGADDNERGTVTLTPFGATAADGVEVDDVPAQQGRYEGVVEFTDPGTWTVRFDASRPAGTAETTVEVQEAGAPGLAAPEDNAGGGFAPADGVDDASSSSDSGVPVLVIAIAALVAISGLAAALRIVLRYGPSATPASTNARGTPAATAADPADEPSAADAAAPAGPPATPDQAHVGAPTNDEP